MKTKEREELMTMLMLRQTDTVWWAYSMVVVVVVMEWGDAKEGK